MEDLKKICKNIGRNPINDLGARMYNIVYISITVLNLKCHAPHIPYSYISFALSIKYKIRQKYR